jgi:hypothetical protein
MTKLLCLASVLLLTLPILLAVENGGEQDYQAWINNLTWSLPESANGLFDCIDQASTRGYDVNLSFDRNNEARTPRYVGITIGRDGTPLYSWKASRDNVFTVASNMLYYALFGQYGGQNVKIVAVNLTTGKEIWRTPTQGPKPPPSLTSMDRVAVHMCVLNTGGALMITVSESAGRYYEIKDPRTGATVAYRAFPVRNDKPSAPAKTQTEDDPAKDKSYLDRLNK